MLTRDRALLPLWIPAAPGMSLPAIFLHGIFLLGIFLFSAAVRADIAPDPLNSGVTMKPYDSDSRVAMAEETVDLTLEPEKLSVRVSFIMENAGPAHDLQVGFPMVHEKELKDFVAKVNGKEVKTSEEVKVIRPSSSSQPKGREIKEPWIVWKMPFSAGKKDVVDVSYWVAPRREMFLIHNTLSSDWFKAGEEERYAPSTAGYILKTGAAWKGKIGKAVVSLRLAGGLTPAHLRGSSPKGAKDVGGRLTWTFKDFKPTEDIQVTFGRLTIKEEIADFEKLDREKNAVWTKLRLADLNELAGDRKKALDIYAAIIPEAAAEGTIELGDEFTYSYVDFCEKAIALGKGLKDPGAAGPVRQKVKKFLSALLAGKVVHTTGRGTEAIRVLTIPEKKRVEALLAASS